MLYLKFKKIHSDKFLSDKLSSILSAFPLKLVCMDEIITALVGGEIKMIPVKVVAASPEVAYYTDSSDIAKQAGGENVEGESLLDKPCYWSYKVRTEIIRRHRSIKDYLFFINHAF